jgi:hypothetical protein
MPRALARWPEGQARASSRARRSSRSPPNRRKDRRSQIERRWSRCPLAAHSPRSETSCGQRVQTLGGKIATLQARRGEPASLLEAEREPTVTEAHVDRLRCHVVDTIEHGDPEAQKGRLQALVARIEVESRASVRPYLRVPLDGGGQTEPNPSDLGNVRLREGRCPRQDSNLRRRP